MSTRWAASSMGARQAGDLLRRMDLTNPQGSNFVSPVSALQAALSANSQSVTVTFQLASLTGLLSVVVLRNTSRDPASATAIQTFAATGLAVGQAISCTDGAVPSAGETFYYWAQAVASGTLATAYRGPARVGGLLVQTGAGPGLSAFDASHSAAVDGVLTVSAVFAAPASSNFGGVRLYISGYQGNSEYVAIAQSGTSPFQFTLLETGEAVTLQARAVDLDGLEIAPAGITKALMLNGSVTVPAQVLSAAATAINGGARLQWTTGLEADVTGFNIYRATPFILWPRSNYWSEATLAATVATSGPGAQMTWDDPAGLTGRVVYFVVAVGSAGDSLPSPGIWLDILYTSAGQAPNSNVNTTNYAVVDSVDAGSSAAVRIYGAAGGVGTSWQMQYGYGLQTYPAGAISGLAYSTQYYVIFDLESESYFATTLMPSTMNDNYAYAGTVTTVAAGGGGGSTGGGQAAGNSGGRFSVMP